eukprot:4899625-Pleurochrysis_carterae.AAC.1
MFGYLNTLNHRVILWAEHRFQQRIWADVPGDQRRLSLTSVNFHVRISHMLDTCLYYLYLVCSAACCWSAAELRTSKDSTRAVPRCSFVINDSVRFEVGTASEYTFPNKQWTELPSD